MWAGLQSFDYEDVLAECVPINQLGIVSIYASSIVIITSEL